MKAVYASTVNHADPLAALAVGEQPEPQARPFWSTVSVRAVTVNHHDVWSLQGVGLAAEQTPMILGTDAVGVLDEDIPGKHGSRPAAKWCCTRSSAPMARAWPRASAARSSPRNTPARWPRRLPCRPPTCSPSPQASPR